MALIVPHAIESARVEVRLVSESDLPELLAMNSDAEVTKFLGYAPWNVLAQAEAWFQRISAQQEAGSALEFVVVAKPGGHVIGRCGLFDFEEANTHARLGYILGRAHWGQGYMREALTALVEAAFRQMRLRKLEANVEAENVRSAHLLQRLGFTREGVLRERWITEGQPMDAEIYGLLRHEWLTSQTSGSPRLSNVTSEP